MGPFIVKLTEKWGDLHEVWGKHGSYIWSVETFPIVHFSFMSYDSRVRARQEVDSLPNFDLPIDT